MFLLLSNLETWKIWVPASDQIVQAIVQAAQLTVQAEVPLTVQAAEQPTVQAEVPLTVEAAELFPVQIAKQPVV